MEKTKPSWLGDMEQDAAEVRAPSTDALTDLAELIQQQRDLEALIIDIDFALAKKRADLAMLSEVKIPEIFQRLGLSELKLSDGAKVEVKPFYAANISEEKKPAAFEWLRLNNFDDMIKHEVKVTYGKGEDEVSRQLTEYLQRIGANYIDKESVHPSTLKAFVRQRVESGDELPVETFGVHIGYKTNIKPAKK